MLYWKQIKRLANLSERLEALEREMKSFRLDWDEMYERYRKMASRVALDRRKIEASSSTTEENGEEAINAVNAQPAPFSSLSPRQRQITEQILRRRATMPLKEN